MTLDIIGTSHIARESLQEVKKAVESGQYDIIALELDGPRMQALLQKRTGTSIRDITRLGVKGYLFGLIGAWAEKKLGKMVGVSPGAEMISAYKAAKKQKLKVALIDQRIDITLRNVSKQLSWREKWNFLVDILTGFFKRPELEFDLTKVPSKEVIKKITQKVKERYPNLYKVLVTDRNTVMARNLKTVMQQNPGKRILAIVGAGHEDELRTLVMQDTITYSLSVG
ncbi:MAG: TraB/GumN family protein [Candidatus Woesearchaeota archaeon]